MKIIADKYQMAASIVQELHPSLAVTIGAYEELTEKVGADSTLAIFQKQINSLQKKKQRQEP